MSREKREWHPNFQEYMDFIVKHPNYKGMPGVDLKNDKINWVTTGKSKLGKQRTEWWKKKAEELNIPTSGKWIGKVVKENHPNKLKVCQTCGREMCIEYVYPTKNFIKKLNNIPGCDSFFKYEDFLPYDQVINKIISKLGNKGYKPISDIFQIPETVAKDKDEYCRYIYVNFVKKERRIFSPGAMSNAPDRLDGFHTYNICCRSSEDTGRHSENLNRYNEDRRAYEHWADGDWKASSWLMSQGGFGKCVLCEAEGKENNETITADHIGPISLGFSHLPIFQPLCTFHNSAKNNRMFLLDVKKLTEIEGQKIDYFIKDKNGHKTLEKSENIKVVSWHAQYIWNQQKNSIKTDPDALILGKAMRISHHYFLELFYEISSAGYKDYLLHYLHPEYAFYEEIEFINLDSSTFEHEGVLRRNGSKKNYHNNAARYIRKAFRALDNYHSKNNRNITNGFIETELNKLKDQKSQIISDIKKDEFKNPQLRKTLEDAFKDKNDDEIDKMISNTVFPLYRSDKIILNPFIHKKIEDYLSNIGDIIIKNRDSL